MLSEIDMLIQNEEVMKAMIQSCKYNKLQTERDTLSEKCRQMNENTGQSAQQKLQVCRVCGAYLSRLDTDRRLADHFMGKLHLGYVTMRKELDMVKRDCTNKGQIFTHISRKQGDIKKQYIEVNLIDRECINLHIH